MSGWNVGDSNEHPRTAKLSEGDAASDGLLEQLIENTLQVEDGTDLFDRMTERVRGLLPTLSFGRLAVRELVSVVVDSKFPGRGWKLIDRERWLDWLVDRLMASPEAERRLRELWGSVCQRVLGQVS